MISSHVGIINSSSPVGTYTGRRGPTGSFDLTRSTNQATARTPLTAGQGHQVVPFNIHDEKRRMQESY